MHQFSSSSYPAVTGTMTSGKPENTLNESTGKLCLRLFGKTCVYIGSLAVVALAALAGIWAIMHLLG